MKINIPYDVQFILDTLQSNNYKAYIVGGCVRDSILNKTPKDWDITTDAEPQMVIDIFNSKNMNIIPTGLKHGTVTIMINSIGYEVTTFRTDGEYNDHRHSDEVTFVKNLKEDLLRRDFTINAMAYNDKEGLIDYFNGMDDIKNKIVKCVGNPNDRFNEDALRMLRFIRFICTLDFYPDMNSLNAIMNNYQTLSYVSKERIRDELCKILLSNSPSFGIRYLTKLNLINYIIPQLKKCVDFEQHNIHHNKDVFDHIMTTLEFTPPILEVRLAAILHDIGKPRCFTMDANGQGHFNGHNAISETMARKILTNLKFDNNTINNVCILVKEHMFRFEQTKNSSIKKFIGRVGINNLDNLFELQTADIYGSIVDQKDIDNINLLKEKCYKIINEKQPLTIKDLAINGNELRSIGYTPGVKMGNKLKELLEIVLENPQLNNKKDLLELAKLK